MFYLIDDPFNVMKEQSNRKRDYEDLEIFSKRMSEDPKKANATLALVKDIYRLTRKGKGKGQIKVL